MNKLNDQNIDEIMFQLLEGEIDGLEREQLLSAIEADSKYASLWETWQQTKLESPSDIPAFNSSRLKKKPVVYMPSLLKYSVAALFILALTLGVYRGFFKHEDVIMSHAIPVPHKKQIPQLMIDSTSPAQTLKDTFVPLKEKVRFIAQNNASDNSHLILKNNPKTADSLIVISKAILPEIISPQVEKLPVIEKNIQAAELLVSIEYEPTKASKIVDEGKPQLSLFQRLFGSSKLKVVNDSTTRTQKKIILENKKYQIIAAF